MGNLNKESISLFYDNFKIDGERTPLDIYKDFMTAFNNQFKLNYKKEIYNVIIGAGPSSHLRFPSYRAHEYCTLGRFMIFDD